MSLPARAPHPLAVGLSSTCVVPPPARGPVWGRPREGAQSPPCCCRRPAGTWRPRWCASTGAATSPAASSPWPTSTPVSLPPVPPRPPEGPPLPFRGLQLGAGVLSMSSGGPSLAQFRGHRPRAGQAGWVPAGHREQTVVCWPGPASGGGGPHLCAPAHMHVCAPFINSILVAQASVQCCDQRGRVGFRAPGPPESLCPLARYCLWPLVLSRGAGPGGTGLVGWARPPWPDGQGPEAGRGLWPGRR